jgi:purine-cytosine permease-like protein
MSTLFGVVAIAVMILVPGYLVWLLLKSIRDERRSAHVRNLWGNFALGIVLCTLFFVSWGAHAATEWRKYVQDQHSHSEPASAGEFVIVFGEATLQNWQSEFLEAFALVVLASVFVHHGSAESRDTEDRIESKLDRVIKKVDA